MIVSVPYDGMSNLLGLEFVISTPAMCRICGSGMVPSCYKVEVHGLFWGMCSWWVGVKEFNEHSMITL